MIELVKKHKKALYIAVAVVGVIIILAIALRYSFVLFITYALVVIAFLIFSLIGLKQLLTYGYTGDFCRPMIWIYSITSGIIIIGSIVLLIALS